MDLYSLISFEVFFFLLQTVIVPVIDVAFRPECSKPEREKKKSYDIRTILTLPTFENFLDLRSLQVGYPNYFQNRLFPL
jgi:hypothetical protein